MQVIVWRNLACRVIDEHLVLPSDHVQAMDGSFQPATHFPQFARRFGRPNALEGLIRLGAVVGALCFAAEVLDELWASIYPPHNREALSRSTRRYIRVRDGEICYYCGVRARDGHVDHMRSRKNRGPNALWNLTWSCAPCNRAKGSLDADEFLGLYGQP